MIAQSSATANGKVAVLMGGSSAEREVSLASGQRVLRALHSLGYPAVAIDWTGSGQDLWADLRRERVEVAFVALHGALGEDGESISRKLTYSAAQPAKDTSVDLTGKGATFTAKGKLSNTENGRPAGTIPVTLTITCASTNW